MVFCYVSWCSLCRIGCLLFRYRMCLDWFFFCKQKTAYEMRISDWSSDVCSSDLPTCLGGLAVETYTVSLLLENVDLTDEVLDAIFTEFEDVVPSSIDGAVKLTASIEAANDESAAFRLIDQVHSVLPQAAPVRLDQDLVSIPDIAERSGRSRESVRLLLAGKRGPRQVPTPERKSL